MPVELCWAVVANNVRVDDFRRLTIERIFDRVVVHTVPSRYPTLWVIAWWRAEIGHDFTFMVRILEPDGAVVAKAGGMNTGSGEVPCWTVVSFSRLVFRIEGPHRIEFHADGQRMPLELSVPVQLIPQFED